MSPPHGDAGAGQTGRGVGRTDPIDFDQFEGIWERFNFRGIPAMIMFKDGQGIHRVIGLRGKAKLVAELEPHLA